MTHDELISQVAVQSNTTTAEAGKFLDTLSQVMGAAFNEGNDVELPQIGMFNLVHRKERQGRNPKTGAALTIPAATVLNFKPAAAFKRQVNP